MGAKLLSPLLVMLIAAGLVSAQEKVDPTGTWKWERDFNDNTIDYTLRLTRDDDKLAGTYKTVFENGPPRLSDPVKIDDGKIEAAAISFAVTRSFNDNEFTVAYSGKLSGDKITGTAEVDFGNGAREFEWNAERVVATAEVVGKWDIKFETPNRVVESSFTLDEDGDKLKGTYHSNFFGDNPIKEIELKENKLSFVVNFQTDNGEFSVAYKAEPRGNKIAGVIVSNFGGQENETSFEGTRPETQKGDDGDDDD